MPKPSGFYASYGAETVQSIKLSIQSTLGGHTWKRVWVFARISLVEELCVIPSAQINF